MECTADVFGSFLLSEDGHFDFSVSADVGAECSHVESGWCILREKKDELKIKDNAQNLI